MLEMTPPAIPSPSMYVRIIACRSFSRTTLISLGLQEVAVTDIEEWFNTQLAAAGYGYYKSGTSNGSPKTIYYKNSRFTRTNAGWFTMMTPDFRTGKWVVLQDKLNTANSYFVVNSHWTTISSAERQLDADTVLLNINNYNTANLAGYLHWRL